MRPETKIMVVGGRWDPGGGRPSKIVGRLAENLGAFATLNGGNSAELRAILPVIDSEGYDALIWMPDVPNDEEKILPDIKRMMPHLQLVCSKRSDLLGTQYTEQDLVGRMLRDRCNLGIMVWDEAGLYTFQLLDPLGNQFVDTGDVQELALALRRRIEQLVETSRIGSSFSPLLGQRAFSDLEFVDVVREFGSELSRFVTAVNPNRFLGNAATRCSYGFPASRVIATGDIFVTRRNVDKETLSEADFVNVAMDPTSSKILYGGDPAVKPSVDAPIDVHLLEHFSNVRYMIHGHAYVDNAPKTMRVIPCGSMREVREIVERFPPAATNFSVNLRGHGFIAFAAELDYLRETMGRLVARPCPEVHKVWL